MANRDDLRQQVNATAATVGDLTGKLQTLRESKALLETESEMSVRQVEEVIAKTALREHTLSIRATALGKRRPAQAGTGGYQQQGHRRGALGATSAVAASPAKWSNDDALGSR